MDAFDWAEQAAQRLRARFTERLAFVGLQGSRARGEAHEGSDIDLVVLIDDLTAADLRDYRAIVAELPEAHLACGFVGSPEVLASWPRHELFQFVNDTRPVLGSLDRFVDVAFTREEACQAARIGASGIYHAACHGYVFDGDAADDILQALFKGAFFTLQALHCARTGEYVPSKAALAPLLAGDEARILEVARAWDDHRPRTDDERLALVDLLLRWSGAIIAEGC